MSVNKKRTSSKASKLPGRKAIRSGARTAAKVKRNAVRQRVSSVRRAASHPKVTKLASKSKAHAQATSVIKPPNESAKGLEKSTHAPIPKLSKAELEHFRTLLLEKRREILGDVGSMESEAFKSQDNHSSSPMHMADVGTDNFEQEFTLGLIESERQLLREIQESLNRIDQGTYGVCVATGKPIGKARLEAKPWAIYCIEYARMLEQGLIRPADESDSHEEEGEEEES